jgi:DNA-binding LytR/AlgR family response regulator
MSMPVIKWNEGGKAEVVFVDVEDVLFFTVNKSKLCVQTLDGLYYLPSSLEDCALIEGFEKLDRPYVVNTGKVMDIDEKYNIVYFSEDRRLQCTVSTANMERAKQLLRDKVPIQLTIKDRPPEPT